MDEELVQFVDHARERGLDHATIRQLLVSAGWKDKEIGQVICEQSLDLAIPKPPRIVAAPAALSKRAGVPRKARDAFLHLLVFGAVYVWSTSVILLVFSYLDFAFPDPAWQTSHARLQEVLSVMRVQLAIVMVAFPTFLYVWNRLLREIREHPETGRSVLRRWLGNLTLFAGSITLAGDLIALIYLMLEGQLTVRFVLKVVVLFLIAGGIVGYLAATLRSEARAQTETTS